MKKQQFIDLINEYISLREDSDNLDKAMRKFDPDFGSFANFRSETLFLDALAIAMYDDAEEDRWIDYWIFELECGKKARKDSVIINGKNVPLKTINDLWKFLIKNKARKIK